MNKYLFEYKFSNILAMLKNDKIPPKETQENCEGSFVVITGATSGIGYETAKYFASRGASLLLINRNKEKSLLLKEEIERTYKVICNFYIADFSHLNEIYECSKMLLGLPNDIDILIHNAGVYNTKRLFTRDGIEEVFQVNYLSSFIINYLLCNKLKQQKHARIIYVNSEGHRFAISGLHLEDLSWIHHHYSGLKSYGSAKTAQLLSMYSFQELFSDSHVTINAMHPGNVKTNMGVNNGKIYNFLKNLLVNTFAREPVLSAKALYYLAVSGELSDTSGKFFNFTSEEIPAPHALDKVMAKKLMPVSLKLAQLE